ncbi:uncharacterized protein LOC113798605 [Dermatophagoides pteronyssinus]|uniref:uncharacterized protein LOC113798605 n=1 Tax=Dermatophagoides pteronyssinus TaxID=6956 RepID=UPI003F6757F6
MNNNQSSLSVIKPNNYDEERPQYPSIFSDSNFIKPSPIHVDIPQQSSNIEMMQSSNISKNRKSSPSLPSSNNNELVKKRKISSMINENQKENGKKLSKLKYDPLKSPRPLLSYESSTSFLKGNSKLSNNSTFIRENIEKRKNLRSKQEKAITNKWKQEKSTKQSHLVIGKAFSPTPYTPDRNVMHSSSEYRKNYRSKINDNKIFLFSFLSMDPIIFNENDQNSIDSMEKSFIIKIRKMFKLFNVSYEWDTILKSGMKLKYETIDYYKMDNLAMIIVNTFAQIMQTIFQSKQQRQQQESEIRQQSSDAENSQSMEINLLKLLFKNRIEKQRQFIGDNQLIDFILEKFECKLSLELVLEKHSFLNYIVIVNGSQTDQFHCKDEIYMGYIDNVEIDYRDDGQWLLFSIIRFKNESALKLSSETKQQMQWYIKPLFYLRPSLRLVETLSHLELNRFVLLQQMIELNSQFCNYEMKKEFKICDNEKYNKQQLNIIQASLNMIMLPHPTYRMLMIQGPPGTGKTYTIIGIVKNILRYLMKNQKFTENGTRIPSRIMICAPSNGAIDEIGLRLISEMNTFFSEKDKLSLKKDKLSPEKDASSSETGASSSETGASSSEKDTSSSNDRKLRIIRIGQKHDIHKGMLPYEIETLTNDNFIKFQMDYLNWIENCKDKDEEKKFKNGKKRTKLRDQLIYEADIILTTLASSQHSSLSMFRSDTPGYTYSQKAIRCLIVDEASQCSEPEFFMPFIYHSITKVIMVGDPLQLPATVISRLAYNAGYGRSLFERFYQYQLQQSNSNEFLSSSSSIIRLTQQYRMHEEICKFPSKLFYDSSLQTIKDSGKNSHIPFHPYFVFSIKDSKESSSNQSKSNDAEVIFIRKLLTEILKKIGYVDNFHQPSPVSIGIITYYREQKKAIKDGLEKEFPDDLVKQIQIDTVDSFQGRECDIIILSCVRAIATNNPKGSIGFVRDQQRMNVALTRARSSLFICLHFESFENVPRWKQLIEDANNRKRLFFVSSKIFNNKLELYLK